MLISKNNLCLILLFLSYIALFSVFGGYINNTYLFPATKLLTFDYFKPFLVFNFLAVIIWALLINLNYKSSAKVANFIIILLSALGFSFLINIYFEASYILDVAHWPLSNLYEVSILLYAITLGLSYVFTKTNKRFSVFIVFLLIAELALIAWLESKNQNMYKELMPALKSYWLPIHVAANFIGYGAFCIAGMAGIMGVCKHYFNLKWLPTLKSSEEISFKAISFGFPMFTLATVLGSLWAYEAWGAYWSWDPKETWALIVWLIYGIYLHLRINNKTSELKLCILSFIALLVTVFCFLGVNLYLSGLHSYGQLS